MVWRNTILTLKNSERFRILLAEAIGMSVFVYVGIAATVQVYCGFYLYNWKQFAWEYGTMAGAAVANGAGLAAAFFICARVTGYHLNPAVSVTFAVFGRTPWRLVPVYLGAQFIGAFIASVVAFSVHVDTIDRFDKTEPYLTDSAFVSFPISSNSSTFSLVWDQTWAASVYSILLFGLTDPRGRLSDSGFLPLLVGSAYALVMLSNNQMAGAAINPARDFCARFFVLIAQYGTSVWSRHGYFFWVPLLMPFWGVFVGALIYHGAIGMYWPPLPPPKPTDRERFGRYLLTLVRDMKEYLNAKKQQELEELRMLSEKSQRVNVDLPRQPPPQTTYYSSQMQNQRASSFSGQKMTADPHGNIQDSYGIEIDTSLR
jgi:glycerol uptake facilitator protein